MYSTAQWLQAFYKLWMEYERQTLTMCVVVGLGCEDIRTAPGGLPGLGVMARDAETDLLPHLKPAIGL